MNRTLKRIAAHLPRSVQHQMKRVYYAHQIRRGTFRTAEPEYDLLPRLVRPGSTVIDVGANIGHYTLRLAQLVGPTGRVYAFEPMPRTYRLLRHNVQVAGCAANVFLHQNAASDQTRIVHMAMPTFSDSGLDDPYEAAIVASGVGTHAVPAVCVDDVVTHPVALIKIDVEGHELQALRGMHWLISRDLPVLIVEGDAPAVRELLVAYGYRSRRLVDRALGLSPNTLWIHGNSPFGCFT